MTQMSTSAKDRPADGLEVDTISGWNELLQRTFGTISASARDLKTFSASLKQIQVGGIPFFECASSPSVVTHNPAQSCDAHGFGFLVKAQMSGSSIVSFNGGAAELHPGDYIICDNSRRYSLLFDEAASMVSTPLSHSYLRKITPFPQDICFSKPHANNPLKGVANDFLYSLHRNHIANISEAASMRLAETFFELVVLSIAEQGGHEVGARRGSDALFHRCCSFIERAASDENLSVSDIAAAAGISVRYLQEIFAEHGQTVSHYIAWVRLEEARSILLTESYCRRSISEVAYSVGFKSHAHFSRAFKAAFGCSPTDIRRKCGDSASSLLNSESPHRAC